MAILLAGEVVGPRPGVKDDHADVADRDHRLRHGLDGGEQAIDVPGALDDDLQLAAAIAAGGQEFLGLLEIVVKGLAIAKLGADFGRDDFARRQRRSVMHGDDADEVVLGREHEGRKAPALGDRQLHALQHVTLALGQGMAEHALVGDDGELRGVDRVGAFAQDFPLRSLLAAAEQEAAHILEIRLVVGVVGAKHLRGAERRAVTREHIGDLALSDRDQIRFVNPVHEREEHVQAAAQHCGLVAGLAVQRDEAAVDRAFRRPQLLDDADLVVRDIAKYVR